MASESISQVHFLLIPLLAPGHTIPMIDIAKLLAQQPNVTVTIVTTPLNAIRYAPTLQDHINSGLPVRFLDLPFPAAEAGLPEGCESAELLPGLHLLPNFSVAVDMLQQKLEQRFESLNPRPSCILSDKFMLWTADTAIKFQIPRIIFDGMSCFKQVCTQYLYASKVLHDLPDSNSPFLLPGLPDKIEIRKAQLPPEFNPSPFASPEHLERVRETESKSYGIVINSFEELEEDYVNELKKIKAGKVWCLGPLSLSNKNDLGKSIRGNSGSNSIDEHHCLKFLDSKNPRSVIYVCFGSSTQITAPQLIELGLGLEASNRPFIWVIRSDKAKELEEWITENGFEERVKDRGLLIRDWAPQLLILSHPSVGGFLTHCGWNSILEGVSVGVPMVTWPQFAEQFLNEKLVVNVLKIGASVGAKCIVHWGEEKKFGVLVESEKVKMAIEKVMDDGDEGKERRKRVEVLGMVANKAIEDGGSSYRNLRLLIEDVRELAKK